MYLKNDFENADKNRIIGKAIKCAKLRSILNKLPMHYVLNVNEMSGNINVFDEKYNQVGYIDIGEDKFEEFE